MTLLGHENRITVLECEFPALKAELAALKEKLASPPAGRSSRIFELLLSAPVLKIATGAILLGAGIKLEQAGEIISRLFG